MATFAASGTMIPAGPIVYPASVKGIWTTIHNSLIATASSAANLVTPLNGSDTNAVFVAVPDGATRAIIRGKCAVALSAVSTSPVIYVWGVYSNSLGVNGSQDVPSDATAMRLDTTAPAAANATGLTLTFAAASSNANVKDSTYLYSQETATIDLEGAAYVLVLVATAGAGMTNGGTPTAEIMFIN